MPRITLEKKGDSHVFQIKQKNAKDEIVVNLNWNQEPEKKSRFFSKLRKDRGGTVDLDLGCFYELSNGRKSVIDGLQFSKGRGGLRTKSTLHGPRAKVYRAKVYRAKVYRAKVYRAKVYRAKVYRAKVYGDNQSWP